MGTVNLCLAVTFQGGNQLPTAGTTTKSHNKSIQKTIAVTLDLAMAVFSAGGSVGEAMQQDYHRICIQQFLQVFMIELISILLLFDEITSLSCLWGHRKSPVEAQRQEIWLLREEFHLQKITIESFS